MNLPMSCEHQRKTGASCEAMKHCAIFHINIREIRVYNAISLQRQY